MGWVCSYLRGEGKVRAEFVGCSFVNRFVVFWRKRMNLHGYTEMYSGISRLKL